MSKKNEKKNTGVIKGKSIRYNASLGHFGISFSVESSKTGKKKKGTGTVKAEDINAETMSTYPSDMIKSDYLLWHEVKKENELVNRKETGRVFSYVENIPASLSGDEFAPIDLSKIDEIPFIDEETKDDYITGEDIEPDEQEKAAESIPDTEHTDDDKTDETSEDIIFIKKEIDVCSEEDEKDGTDEEETFISEILDFVENKEIIDSEKIPAENLQADSSLEEEETEIPDKKDERIEINPEEIPPEDTSSVPEEAESSEETEKDERTAEVNHQEEASPVSDEQANAEETAKYECLEIKPEEISREDTFSVSEESESSEETENDECTEETIEEKYQEDASLVSEENEKNIEETPEIETEMEEGETFSQCNESADSIYANEFEEAISDIDHSDENQAPEAAEDSEESPDDQLDWKYVYDLINGIHSDTREDSTETESDLPEEDNETDFEEFDAIDSIMEGVEETAEEITEEETDTTPYELLPGFWGELTFLKNEPEETRTEEEDDSEQLPVYPVNVESDDNESADETGLEEKDSEDSEGNMLEDIPDVIPDTQGKKRKKKALILLIVAAVIFARVGVQKLIEKKKSDNTPYVVEKVFCTGNFAEDEVLALTVVLEENELKSGNAYYCVTDTSEAPSMDSDVWETTDENTFSVFIGAGHSYIHIADENGQITSDAESLEKLSGILYAAFTEETRYIRVGEETEYIFNTVAIGDADEYNVRLEVSDGGKVFVSENKITGLKACEITVNGWVDGYSAGTSTLIVSVNLTP